MLSEGQLRVRGKGSKLRFLPLAPETTQLIDHYLRLERPDPCSAALFVVLKGPARGTRMTPAGLRSLFRHHRRHHRHPTGQPAPLQAHLRLGYGACRHQPARAHAVDGSRRHRNHPALCAGLPAGRLPSVRPRCGTVHPTPVEDPVVKRWRRPPLQHPLAPAFARAVESLSTALSPSSTRQLQHQRCVTSSSIWPPSTPKLPVSSNCAAIRTSSDGCRACVHRFHPWRPQPASAGSSLCAPSSTNWHGQTSFLNSLT